MAKSTFTFCALTLTVKYVESMAHRMFLLICVYNFHYNFAEINTRHQYTQCGSSINYWRGKSPARGFWNMLADMFYVNTSFMKLLKLGLEYYRKQKSLNLFTNSTLMCLCNLKLWQDSFGKIHSARLQQSFKPLSFWTSDVDLYNIIKHLVFPKFGLWLVSNKDDLAETFDRVPFDILYCVKKKLC